MPKVIIWRDGAIETEFDPGHRDWRMGRSETNDITLLDPRKSVSRFHAELREEILDERAREFAFEEIRWFDIVRWKRADIFRQTLYGIRVTILDGTDSSNFRFNFSEPVPETDRAWKNSFDPKWYLSAFPSNEVNKGYGLTQNAGW